jgi:GT2 family glycosyltransferase
MSKSLVAILHFNSPQYTDTLYELLKPYEGEDYDLEVIDNGSAPERTSKYTTMRLEENIYYGGGLDVTMQYFIENKQYDSMLLLNSDLIVHGYNFVKALRHELFTEEDLVGVSACVMMPSKDQCYWKMNHNWNSKELRYVPWVDYQCILLKRKFVEHVGGFGSKFGWVQDHATGIVCQEMGWKIGVCDWIPVIHFSNGSVNDNLDDPIVSKYNQLADAEMVEYFQSKGLWDKFIEQRQRAEAYQNYWPVNKTNE